MHLLIEEWLEGLFRRNRVAKALIESECTRPMTVPVEGRNWSQDTDLHVVKENSNSTDLSL